MMYCIEEYDSSDFYSTDKFYECIDERSPYMIIVHNKDNDPNRIGYFRLNHKSVYLISTITQNLFVIKNFLRTNSKDEVKIWMDLNGYNMTDKIVVYYQGTKKIHLEMFKLERI